MAVLENDRSSTGIGNTVLALGIEINLRASFNEKKKSSNNSTFSNFKLFYFPVCSIRTTEK